ncbi:MAG TPA: hypothetical protein VF737_10980 [Gemmatimonadaceae bacterium]
MSDTSRKWAGRAFQFAVVLIALAFAGNWIRSHFNSARHDSHVAGLEMPPDSLGPGDIRIMNADSTVDLVLVGDRIWAGLSPRMVAKVRRDMDTSQHADTGLGGSIAKMVKSSVAGAIGTHVVYRVSDIRDVRFDSGRVIFDWKSGGHDTMFKNTRVNGDRSNAPFTQADAERFIAAVQERQKQIGKP